MSNTEWKQDETVDEMLQAADAERQKALYRHKLPQSRDLRSMLDAMTKQELDDIRANLNVKGASSLKKAELVERLAVEIPEFLQRWLPSLLEEEAGLFERLLGMGGISQEYGDGDSRFDYLRGLGFLSCGVKEGTLYWYLPQEICDGIDAFLAQRPQEQLKKNSESARLAAGVLFYYGYLDYEALYDYVAKYQREAGVEPLDFGAFVAVLLNASCWSNTLTALPTGAKYFTLLHEEQVEDERLQRTDLSDAVFTYQQVYAAGTESYVEATPAYKSLAAYLMQQYGLSVLEAGDLVAQAQILLQNGSSPEEVAEYLAASDAIKAKELGGQFLSLLASLNNTMHLWLLKGHTPQELMDDAKRGTAKLIPFDQVRRHKVGRNDPCPCGSGKKYKHCCMRKDEN